MAKLTREDAKRIIKEARDKGETPNLSGADLRGGYFTEEDLIYMRHLEESTKLGLSGMDFSKVDLSKANLNRANLNDANLSQADLSEADLCWAYLYRANVQQADLRDANLNKANLRKGDLKGATLSGADFSGAKLDGANFGNVRVERTIFVNVDLGKVKGLSTVRHKDHSIIDINTIHHSKDKIPTTFLEQAGIHPDIIRWQHSLHTRPTVFISYNHKDEKEKDQLITHLGALQRNDLIDVWHDHRIKGGDDWKDEIKKAMERASVAILLISANFLSSDFIFEEEIPTFLQRQKSAEQLHIYPIIAKSCAWQAIDWLAKMQVRPKGGNPIWGKDTDPDTELAKIADEITDIIKELMFKRDW